MTTIAPAAPRVQSTRVLFSAIVAPSFADDLRIAVFGPSAADDAWHSGYELGLAFIDADPPSGLSDFCRSAFEDGWDKGRQQAEDEREEAFAHLHDDKSYPDWDEAELSRCFGRDAGKAMGR